MSASRSLVLATDLLTLPASSEVDRFEGTALRVVTRDNPAYHWGNFLAFDAPPGPGDGERWDAAFRRAFGDVEGVRHRAICWEGGAPGAADELGAIGYELDQVDALVATGLQPCAAPSVECELRVVAGDADWEAVVRNQLAHLPEQFRDDRAEAFQRGQVDAWREHVAAGRGAWFGAFVDGRLASDVGLIHDGGARGLARYQSAGTHPDFRRRGLCRALVRHAGLHALDRWPVQQLVIVADADEPAHAIYRSLGFEVAEHGWAATLVP